MADKPHHDSDADDEEVTPGYKVPAHKTTAEMLSQDKEDASLEEYKRKLLGADNPTDVILFPSDPRKVIVQKLGLAVPGREEMFQDLSDVGSITKEKFTIKEGCQYRLKMYFYVQREIVTGLVYTQKVYKKHIKVGSNRFMAGSYGPKKEMHCYESPLEDAPSGMIARGSYVVKSVFKDDDNNEYLKWEWKLEIKKDWEN